MTRRITIAALFAVLGLAAVTAGAAAPAIARDCGPRCAPAERAALAQYRGQADGDEARRPPFLRGPAAADRYYGGRLNERRAITMPVPGARPLSDDQIWAIAKSRVPGRIVNARLHGSAYSFRIISNRGSIVDVVVDRYSGRILSVRGGP